MHMVQKVGQGQTVRADICADALLSLHSNASDHRHAWPAVDGATDTYVGWMKVPYDGPQCEIYVDSRDFNWFSSKYCCPSAVMDWPWTNC